MIAYLRWPLVVWVGDPAPFGLVYDTIMPDAVNPVVGKVWSGSAFVDPAANSEQANAATIDAQLAQAMAAIDTYAALSAPTAAQRLNYERLLGKCVKQLIRFRLNKLDAAT
jgi:hypothetical protein